MGPVVLLSAVARWSCGRSARAGRITSTSPTRVTMTDLDLSKEQLAALAAITDWHHHSDEQVFLLEGPAGTGKTTIARHIGALLGDIDVVYGAYTGKAASVMHDKGCADAETIHSLIYIPRITYSCVACPPCLEPPCPSARTDRCPHVREIATDYMLNPRSAIADADLVVIDEVSMVGAELGRDLLSFGTKVLVIGDRNQLPPIGDGGYFTNREPDQFMVGAALSGDQVMIEFYLSGDPYLAFAKRVGAAPEWATKQTNKELRARYKTALLAIQYGVSEHTLAAKLNVSVIAAREMIGQHKQLFAVYWAWVEDWIQHSLDTGIMWTVYDWRCRVGITEFNSRTIGNFPVQAV